MNIRIIYKGDLGVGEMKVDISDDACIIDLISLFHEQIGKSKTYKISGGAPPFRRSISVEYDYTINSKRVRGNSMDDLLSVWEINDGSTVSIRTGGGGKVD